MKSRKLVLDKPYGNFSIKEENINPEITPRAILLKTELVGVCATDTHIYKGGIKGIQFPLVLGHEFVGTIEQMGSEVYRDTTGDVISVGDRIIPMPATPCCRCPECVLKPGPVVNCDDYDVTGFSLDKHNRFRGGMSEYIELDNPNTRLFKTSLSPEIAVLTEPFCTPIHGVQRIQVKLGDTALIQGSGAVGILSVAAAISAGATDVIVIGGPTNRLNLCLEFGASHVINIEEVQTSSERIEQVKEITKGKGVDVVIEAAGVASAIPEGIRCLKNGGRYLEVGCFADVGSTDMNPNELFLAKNITLAGSSGYGPDHFLQALKILEAGRFPFGKLVSHQIQLDKGGEGILALTPENNWMLDGEEVIKVTINPLK